MVLQNSEGDQPEPIKDHNGELEFFDTGTDLQAFPTTTVATNPGPTKPSQNVATPGLHVDSAASFEGNMDTISSHKSADSDPIEDEEIPEVSSSTSKLSLSKCKKAMTVKDDGQKAAPRGLQKVVSKDIDSDTGTSSSSNSDQATSDDDDTASSSDSDSEPRPKSKNSKDKAAKLRSTRKRSQNIALKLRVSREVFLRSQVQPSTRLFGRLQGSALTARGIVKALKPVEEVLKAETESWLKVLAPGFSGLTEAPRYISDLRDDPQVDAEIATGLNSAFKDKYKETNVGISKAKTFILTGLDQSQREMYELDDIFGDEVSRAIALTQGKFTACLRHLEGRVLSIGTMCSGTESPMLALKSINDALARLGETTIDYTHVISCEIKVWKQAYIQRNFKPLHLFRDVEELPGDFAHTAFGAWVAVPGNLDLLIAGTACVDFSNLNEWKKGLGQGGKSDTTLKGVLGYAYKYEPRIVILENVKGAPWDQIQEAWQDIGYETQAVSLDTKDFYLPQTRERGYMVAINRKFAQMYDVDAALVTKVWVTIIRMLQRRASSPFTDFIFSEDDPRLYQVRRELAVSQARNKSSGKTDWKCSRLRHLNIRAAYALGLRKPITNWESNGTCTFPDGCWLNWSKRQVERLWDCIDINHLRYVGLRDYDMFYKHRVIELSQNADRDADSRPWGIVGCITPSGQPYLSTRGGPITGPEAIALQGIPTDNLSLTYETSRQTQDFAGNAMSTPVVCAAILAALGAGYPMIGHGQVESASARNRQDVSNQPLRKDSILQRYEGEDLIKNNLPTYAADSVNFDEIMELASETFRYCSCEGQFGCEGGPFQECSDCGHTTCTACGLNPLHSYRIIPERLWKRRTKPSIFEEKLRKCMPLELQFSGIDPVSLKQAIQKNVMSMSIDPKLMSAVLAAFTEKKHLYSISRMQTWTVVYDSLHSRLELVFRRTWNCFDALGTRKSETGCKTAARWYLFAKPGPLEPAHSMLRTSLEQPIALMNCGSSLLDGRWQIRIPQAVTFVLSIDYSGCQVDSWEKKQGLQDTMFCNRQASQQITLSSPDDNPACPRRILGVYDWLQDCGTACGSLHRKVGMDAEGPIFFFLDPRVFGHADGDSFVFSMSHNRLQHSGTRDIIARVEKKWRPDTTLVKTFECETPGRWTGLNASLNAASQEGQIERWAPSPQIARQIDSACCSHATTLAFICSFPLQEDRQKQWRSGRVYVINLVDKVAALRPFTFLMQKAGPDCSFDDWKAIQLPTSDPAITICTTCAPSKPLLVHEVVPSTIDATKTQQIRHVEDRQEALTFEMLMKARPPPVESALSCFNGQGVIEMNLNVVTLFHRALAKQMGLFPNRVGPSRVQWRLATDRGFEQLLPFPTPVLLSNRNDPIFDTFPSFRKNGPKPLRESQRRSIAWMRAQESISEPNWIEQEIEEARIPSADLRLEVKVERECTVLGGVLADEVGYGKTATTLGLFDSDAKNATGLKRLPDPGFAEGDRRINVKATLILVPNTLIDQWKDEVEAFMPGNDYEVKVVSTVTELMSMHLEALKSADLIISTWDIFNATYLQELAQFSMTHIIPEKPGRAFEQWLNQALESLGNLVEQSRGFNPDQSSTAGDALNVSDPACNSGDDYELPSETSSGASASSSSTRKRKARGEHVDSPSKHGGIEQKMHAWLHCLRFRRLVIDEFTYVKDRKLSLILKISAERKWILSGTPPLGGFADVNRMAQLLGTKLSNDENDGGLFETQAQLTEKLRNKTDVEAFCFHSFEIRRSVAWYHARRDLSLEFLERFVRQNPADTKTIERHEHYIVISLSADERATYFQLFQMLMHQSLKLGQDAAKVAAKKGRRDRTRRMQDMATVSQTPEEALLICCSTSMSDVNGIQTATGRAQTVFGDICAEIEKHLHETFKKLMAALKEVFIYVKRNGEDGPLINPYLHAYLRHVQKNRLGDEAVKGVLDRAIGYAEALATAATLTPQSGKTVNKVQERKKYMKKKAAALEGQLHTFIDDARAFRFFSTIKDFVDNNRLPHCSGCGRRLRRAEETLIMGLCGHSSCAACFDKKQLQRAVRDECVSEDCGLAAPHHTAIRFSDFDRNASGTPQIWSSKIGALLKLLRDPKKIRPEDFVVIFVQFDRIKAALTGALKENRIQYSDGSAEGEIEDFKKGIGGKICVLDLDSAEAAGWNLQFAKRVIFLSSFVANSQSHYDAVHKQGLGRVFRLGQEGPVDIYYFLAAQTIDVNILQERTRKTLVRRGGIHKLVEKVEQDDKANLEGARFEGAACSASNMEPS